MKCPVCIEKGLKSSVYPGFGSCTAMYCAPYYDEDGKYHNHDMNTSTYSYSCSQGHKWTVSSNEKCPSCDFGKESTAITITNDSEITPQPILLFTELCKAESGSFAIISGSNNITVSDNRLYILKPVHSNWVSISE